MAGYNARSCHIGHDKCHATHAYPQAGQNVGVVSENHSMSDISWVIFKWFQHMVTGSMSTMKHDSNYGQFLTMVHQKSAYVGCALVGFKKERFTKYLVCNYEYKVRIGEDAYTVGKPCSKCPQNTTCSKIYPGLCM